MSFVKDTMWGSMTAFASRALNFLFQIIILWLLIPEDAAAYFIALSVSYLLLLPTTYLLSPIVARYIPYYEGKGERKKSKTIFITSIVFSVFFGLLALVLLFGMEDIVGSIYTVLSGKILFVGLITFAMSIWMEVYDNLFAHFLFKENFYANMIQSLVKLGGVALIFLIGMDMNFEWVAIVTILSLLISSFYGFIKLHRLNTPYELEFFNMKEILSKLKFSLSGSIMYAKSLSLTWLDTNILGYYNPARDVSGYNATAGIARNFINIITSSLSSAVLPHVSKKIGKGENGEFIFREITRAGIYVAIFATILLALLSNEITALFFPKYTDYSSLITLNAIGFVAFSLSSIFRSFIMALRWAKPLFYIAVFSIVASVVLYFTLIPIYGVVGAVAATITVY
ncbi:MAG: oligosaccharide flippase family protein, partial [Candidatus Bilamarchaeaceae archaeon]